MRTAHAVCCLAVVATSLAMGRSSHSESTSIDRLNSRAGATSAIPAQVPNRQNRGLAPIIVYLIDTLRADHVGALGSHAGLTPRIDGLAAESVVFEQAYSQAPWTLPSVVSLLTSTFPPEHGVVDNRCVRPEKIVTLGQRLSRLGYVCAAFTSNAFASWAAGDDCGYPEYTLSSAPGYPDALFDWLHRVEGKPFHAYVHTTEPHNPYGVPQGIVDRLAPHQRPSRARVNNAMKQYRRLTRMDFAAQRSLGETDNTDQQREALAALTGMGADVRTFYQASVVWADGNLGRLIDALKARHMWDDCLFVLVADHGEELGDHHGWQHDETVYDELVHVPLIIKFPRGSHAGARVRSPVRLVDVMPTLLQYIGASGDASLCRGTSLLPRVEAPWLSSEAPTIVASRMNTTKYFRPNVERRGNINIAVRQGDWKGIFNVETDTFELYDLAADPREMHDQAALAPHIRARLQSVAQDWYARFVPRRRSGPAPMTSDLSDNLRTLGYIGD